VTDPANFGIFLWGRDYYTPPPTRLFAVVFLLTPTATKKTANERS